MAAEEMLFHVAIALENVGVAAAISNRVVLVERASQPEVGVLLLFRLLRP
jgi:hypothetical protein